MVKRQAEDTHFEPMQSKMMFSYPNQPGYPFQPLTTPTIPTHSPNDMGFFFPPQLDAQTGLSWGMEDDKDQNFNDTLDNTTPMIETPEKEEKLIPVEDPLTHTTYYISETKLSKLLQEHGSLISNNKNFFPGNSMAAFGSIKQQKHNIIEKFCNAKSLASCTENDVRELIRLKVNITPVTNRDAYGTENGIHRGQPSCYKCVICAVIDPAAQPKFLGNKENLKRHYHRHLEYKRFHCTLCNMGFFRKDNTRRHISKEHKKNDPERYVREHVAMN